jgi:hypothetical protein
MTDYKVNANARWPSQVREDDFTPGKYKKDTPIYSGATCIDYIDVRVLLVLFLFVPASINTLFFDNDGYFFEVLSAIWLVITLVYVLLSIFAVAFCYYGKRRKEKEALNEAERKAKQALNEAKMYRLRQAEDLSNYCNGLLKQCVDIQERLPEYLKQAGSYVKKARSEFVDNAYAPFWNQIERATKSLDAYYQGIRQLNDIAKSYASSLKGKDHNFPVFPITTLVYQPDPVALVKGLRETIRKGQTNFEFASIYEQRRTQKIIILGFRCLGDAIDNISYTIDSALSQLASSVSYEIDRVSANILDLGNSSNELHKETNRMLSEQLENSKCVVQDLSKISQRLGT